MDKIFSIKNKNYHKIITILGIKIKLKNTAKQLSDTLAHFITCEKNKILKEIKNSDTRLNSKFNDLNKKYKKEFLVDTINNPDYFDIQQEIFNFYEEMKARKFYPIFRKRIQISNINKKLEHFKKRFQKEPVILTDIDDLSVNYSIINIKDIPNFSDSNNTFFLIYNNDFEAIKAIKYLNKYNLKYYSITQAFPLARYFNIDELAYETLLEESDNDNWHFCPVDFENIFQALNASKNLEGDYVEIGTFKGDSASAALNYMKKAKILKQAYFLDTFTGFNYPEAKNSIDTYWQNTHTETSYEEVKKRLSKYENAEVIQCNIISEELPLKINNIAVANIDVDMYDAVKAALYKVKDKVVTNGIIIAEDYGHTPSLIGAQKAVQEFLEENPEKFIPIYLNSGQLFLIKK